MKKGIGGVKRNTLNPFLLDKMHVQNFSAKQFGETFMGQPQHISFNLSFPIQLFIAIYLNQLLNAVYYIHWYETKENYLITISGFPASYQIMGMSCLNNEEKYWHFLYNKLVVVSLLEGNPTRGKWTTRQNQCICDLSLYIVVTFKTVNLRKCADNSTNTIKSKRFKTEFFLFEFFMMLLS